MQFHILGPFGTIQIIEISETRKNQTILLSFGLSVIISTSLRVFLCTLPKDNIILLCKLIFARISFYFQKIFN